MCLSGHLATKRTPDLILNAAQTGAQEKVLSWACVSLTFLGLKCKEVTPLQARNGTKSLEWTPKG